VKAVQNLNPFKTIRTLFLVFWGVLWIPLVCFSENSPRASGPGHSPVVSKSDLSRLKDRVFLKISLEKMKCFNHELVPLTVTLFSRDLTLTEVQYPRLSSDDFSISAFENPVQKKERVEGTSFEVLEFKTTLSPKRSGLLSLGPARLQCLFQAGPAEEPPPQGTHNPADTYFGGTEKVPLLLESEKVMIQVMPLPKKEKPSDFKDAVGDFTFKAEIFPLEVKAGEPVTLRMTVQGQGDLNTVVCPTLDQNGPFKTFRPQFARAGNAVIFEQVLIPQDGRVRRIPRIRFSFFDPGKGIYRTLYQGPFLLTITTPDSRAGLKSGYLGPGEEDRASLKEWPGPLRRKGDLLLKNGIFLLAHGLFLLLFVLWLAIHKRRERLRTDIPYARRLKARKEIGRGLRKLEKMRKAEKVLQFYDSLFKIMRAYFGDRFNLPSAGLTLPAVEIALKPRGLDETVLNRVKEIFMVCDQVRYGSLLPLETIEMEKTLFRSKEVIRYFESWPL
jgi:hypothetical protein